MIPWTARELHVTKLTTIPHAEIEHGGERVILQIRPYVPVVSSGADELELTVSVFIPGADEARLRQAAALMMEALYE